MIAAAAVVELLRERAGELQRLHAIAVDGAALLLDIAQEIEGRNRDARALLTPREAATWSGYTVDQLRRYVRAGRLTNYGTAGKAMYCRDELPRKANHRISLLRESDDACTVRGTREQIARVVVERHGGD